MFRSAKRRSQPGNSMALHLHTPRPTGSRATLIYFAATKYIAVHSTYSQQITITNRSTNQSYSGKSSVLKKKICKSNESGILTNERGVIEW